VLANLSDSTIGVPLYYADYLKGEAYLHKGDYVNSISSYRWFINHQTGQNYIKDAYYKIGLCYWLNGNENDALTLFKEARSKGKEATEADKSAARSLSEKEPPHVKLSRVRYFTDGGYYEEADTILSGLTSMDLTEKKDQVEYYYRMARLAHKLSKPDAAKFYLLTIEMTGQDSWYFAPNACLQLGYIYQAQNKLTEAEEYFRRALSYQRHEYKNSIDSKARSALAQLGRI
jgi:tetratricopeptide (TPR) repeat protein